MQIIQQPENEICCKFGRGGTLASNMKARASTGKCSGRLLSLAIALSKVAVSGPCGVMHTCRLAPASSMHILICKSHMYSMVLMEVY